MLDPIDRENLVKSCKAAELLVANLNTLIKSENPLLSELAIHLRDEALTFEQRLARIEIVTNPEP